MNPGALAFMLLAWTCVLGLAGWCYYRLLRTDPASDTESPPDTSLSV